MTKLDEWEFPNARVMVSWRMVVKIYKWVKKCGKKLSSFLQSES